MSEPGGTIFVCVDCAETYSSGEAVDVTPRPWALWLGLEELTLGTGLADDVERIEFSCNPCQGCGNQAAGTRIAFTWWEEV